jgi:hypothetical protein
MVILVRFHELPVHLFNKISTNGVSSFIGALICQQSVFSDEGFGC